MQTARSWRGTLAVRILVAMGALLLTSIVMISNTLVLLASIEGNATWVNMAGMRRLRMAQIVHLAYRLETAQGEAHARVERELREAMLEMDARLLDLLYGSRSLGIPAPSDPPIIVRVESLQKTWRLEIRPLIERMLVASTPGEIPVYLVSLDRVGGRFREDVENLTRVYDELAEARVRRTQLLQVGFLVTVVVVLVVMLWLLPRIVAHERAAARERDQEARIRAILDSTAEGIITIDEEGRLASMNRAAERLFGYPPGEILGRDVMHLVSTPPGQTRAGLFGSAVRAGRRGGGSAWQELQGRRRDGSLFPMHVSVNEVGLDGGRIHTAVVHDLTDRKQLEDQLRQAQKMEAIGKFAGGIAHDFNNLLLTIMGRVEQLRGHVRESDPARRPVEEIRKAGERATSLTRQLLAFSRQQVLQRRVVDLNALVVDTSTMLRPVLGDEIEIRLDLDSSLDAVEIDPGQLVQVLLNLTMNARDAMPRGGRLTIETTNLFLEAEDLRGEPDLAPGAYVALSIRDTGFGMSEEIRSRIFEPFYTTKESGKGTGLGLATVHGIVRQSGGFVRVESAPGEGAVFRVHFQRAEGPVEPETREEPRKAAAAAGESVLLVEDDEAARDVLEELLEESGYRVLKASDGVEALRVCEKLQAPIDLVITDMRMPGMTGRELFDHLSGKYPGLRGIFMSGFTEDEVFERGSPSENVRFLQKPFRLNDLLDRMRELLRA